MAVSVWIEPWDRMRHRGLAVHDVPAELRSLIAERRDDGDALFHGRSHAA
jgi:hypothetical protein